MPGTEVHIGYFDTLLTATVAEEPLFDPKMTRLPRSVAEVLRVFETVSPRLLAAAQAPKNL